MKNKLSELPNINYIIISEGTKSNTNIFLDKEMSSFTNTNTNKMFEYKSNVEIDGWWHQEFNTVRKLKFYVYLAEIAGCKFEEFTSFIDFNNFVNSIIAGKSHIATSIKFVMYQKKYIISKNQFRIIEAEVNKTRRIRSKKINKLPCTYNILKLLVRITKNSLPSVLNKVIIKEFLGLDNFGGCCDCKKAGRSLDTLISHQTEMCKFSNKKLQCINCKHYGEVCISHTTSECSYNKDYNYSDYDDTCDYCGRSNCTIFHRDDESDYESERGEFCVYCRTYDCYC